jgi:hypothetical protein
MLGLEFQQVEDEEGQGSIHSCWTLLTKRVQEWEHQIWLWFSPDTHPSSQPVSCIWERRWLHLGVLLHRKAVEMWGDTAEEITPVPELLCTGEGVRRALQQHTTNLPLGMP